MAEMRVGQPICRCRCHHHGRSESDLIKPAAPEFIHICRRVRGVADRRHKLVGAHQLAKFQAWAECFQKEDRANVGRPLSRKAVFLALTTEMHTPTSPLS